MLAQTTRPTQAEGPAQPGLRSNRTNAAIAGLLEQVAALMAEQGANPFRVGAYRRAARSLRTLDREVSDVAAQEGNAGLQKIPGVGRRIAAAIEEILRTGRWMQLARLRGEADPEQLFRTIAGVGPSLARRIHENLHVDTLEALEIAAHDGRLETVPGIGRRRAAAIRSLLAEMLQRVRVRPITPSEEPSVTMLLDVDREYRMLAKAERLPKIAPKRFNPKGEAWLPILHTERDGWNFTALYSNTARAHELGRVGDWVIVYFEHDTQAEGQRTIVTEMRGELAGKRVVRGRERESAAVLPRSVRSRNAEVPGLS